jgi:predicted DNA-binding transcriptional regulator YafY
MSDNRNEQVLRIFRIIDFLSNSRYGKTIHQIHAHLVEHGCHVNDRTVRRDIKALEAMMVPMTEQKNEDGASLFSIEPNSLFSQQFVLTPKTLLGLYLMKGFAGNFKSSPFSKDFQELFLTIDGCLNEKAREFFQELASVVQAADKVQWGHLINADIFATIQAACAEEHVLEADYDSVQTGLRNRRLGPHAIYFDRGAFYLLAEDLESGSLKTFAVPRFKQARILNEPYNTPKVNPKEYYRDSFGVWRGETIETVVLEFSREVAVYAAETQWHPSQKAEILSDGRLRLTISIALTPDFVNWVVSFGDKATVQEPESLKHRIYEIATILQKRYAPNRAG